MSENLTAEYADRIARDINAACEAGHPFGFVNSYDGQTAETMADIDGHDADEHDADNLPDSWERASASDYLSAVLDFRYVVGRDGGYLSGEVCITLGGPNVWISTADREVAVHWGGKSETRGLRSQFIDALDAALGEMWEMSR